MEQNIESTIEYPKSRKQLRLALILGAIIAVLALSSCVSQKKYDQALQEIARLNVDSTIQDYKLADVRYSKSGVIYDQKKDLSYKSQKLDSLKALVDQQEAELVARRDLINNLRNSEWMTNVREDKLVIELKNDIVFDTGEDNLSIGGKSVIKSISSALLEVEEPIEIWVIGHTDNQPFDTKSKDNWDLSADRALSVVRELVNNGIKPETITASAKSKYDPRSPNKSELGKQLNRRTEIIIVTKESPYETLSKLLTSR